MSMKKIVEQARKIAVAVSLLFFSYLANAQVEMADDFRGEGKIYVVIAIVLIILIGFFVMLFKLDRKSKRIEKELEER